MRVLVINEDMDAASSLEGLLRKVEPMVQVTKANHKRAQQILSSDPVDLLFVHLAENGGALRALTGAALSIPVIFTSSSSDNLLPALQYICVDYLILPINADNLRNALLKYRKMAKAFTPVEAISPNADRFKTCFAAKHGKRTVFVPTVDICFFSAHNKSVMIADYLNNRFVLDTTISKLESALDPQHFFRINRKMIVHGKRIRLIKPHANNRVCIGLSGVETKEQVIVSRERAASFRKWMAAIAD